MLSPRPVVLLPITIWLEAVADEGSASVPIIVLLDPDVITLPAPFPKPILLDPVLRYNESYPNDVLLLPVVLPDKA